MLKRFFFDVINDESIIVDEQGVDAANLEQALDDAKIVLGQIADELGASSIKDSWTLVIRDQSGMTVAHIPIGLFSNPKKLSH